jgi:hypothetical protein
MGQYTATDRREATATATGADCGLERQVEEALAWLRPRLIDLARELEHEGMNSVLFLQFELALVVLVRDFGRLLMELWLNTLEGDGSRLPHDVLYLGQGYRRLGKKTRNAHVATLFGTIFLWRFPYRFWEPFVKESCIFPLELRLGLIAGVTPALADYIGRRMAEAGATQNRVLTQLKDEHGVSMGVKRLRNLISALSDGMAEHRQAAQVNALLAALQTAQSSRGNRKPVLALGRDGITLCNWTYRFWEVATTGTITVFDRAGKRLTTIYLASRPELGQATMSEMLTAILTELFEQWTGPLPNLAYVADSGGNESSYFEDVLARMRHPRTHEALHWQRVVDFYHAAERIWAMAAALFPKGGPKKAKWARRMLQVLKKKRRGAKRVLHSAASLAAKHKMGKSHSKAFRTAYNYIRKRTKWMRYHDYKERHIPLGSGITEAACKTIYTQRLKLSGMRWKPAGSQMILNLRTILLSRTWHATYAFTLAMRDTIIPIPYATNDPTFLKKAA